MRVLGQRDETGRWCRLGRYLARDGSDGGAVGLDLERPHAALLVGKRGSGKSHTLGVLAEGVTATDGVGGVVADPTGELTGLAADGPLDGTVAVRAAPRVAADALPPRAWPALLDLDPTGGAGGLVWRAAAAAPSLPGMRSWVADRERSAARRAALNHLELAASWEVFDTDGLTGAALLDGRVTVLDLAGLDPAPANAVLAVVATGLHEAAGEATTTPLPWLFVDEAHVFLEGVARGPLERVLTRGRTPGVSLVAATQRPGACPPVAVSQADLLLAHRFTATEDVAALAAAGQTYHERGLRDRLPDRRGVALVVDDRTESTSTVRVRDRHTPHGGASPRASERRPEDA